MESIRWLLEGDPSIQYQTHRDLLENNRPKLQAQIAKSGWGRQYLDHRNEDGSWGDRFYQPKWTSSHYTLLEMRVLQFPKGHPLVDESISKIVNEQAADDGGIGCSRNAKKSDVCVNGMFLNYACYFGIASNPLRSVVDFLLNEHMGDGGFNCESNGKGARHSSLHSTLSVLEGILEYEVAGHKYRLNELRSARKEAHEFILMHRLYKSDRTGNIINKDFLKLTYPPRWRYNVLRALDYFRATGCPFDERMMDAINHLKSQQRSDGLWPSRAGYPGKVHFVMEQPKGPGRWNTLKALRVLSVYG